MRAPLRLLPLLLAGTLAAAEGYAFAPGQVRVYRSTLDQTVAWQSAGDRIAFASTVAWRYALRVTAVEDGAAAITAVVLHVSASHEGPGSAHRVDSAQPATADDPLLGHLVALEGAVIRLRVETATGRVLSAAADEALFARLAALRPSGFPGQPGPVESAARRLYAPEALADWWTALLALPSSTPQALPLPPPLAGQVQRTWEGTAWTLAAAGDLPVRLLGEPTPVEGVLTALTGSGTATPADGLPGLASGEVAFTLRLTALTQPVEQQHRLRWRLEPLAAAADGGPDGAEGP